MLGDPGSLWHTVVGRRILEGGALIRTDPFSFTCQGQPWIAQQWLGAIAMALEGQRTKPAVPAFDGWIARCDRVPLLFVLHGDVICALLRHLLALPPERVRTLLVRPCSVTELVPAGSAWRMVRFSDDGFLPAALRRELPAGAG